MQNGPTHLGLSFLNVFKRLMFSVERRTDWLAERSGGTDRFLLPYWMWNGPTHLGLSFLDVFKRLVFSIERRTVMGDANSSTAGRLTESILSPE